MKNLVLLHVIRMTKLFTYSFLIQFLSMSFLFAWNGNAQVKDIEEVMITLSFENTKVERAFSSIESSFTLLIEPCRKLFRKLLASFDLRRS